MSQHPQEPEGCTCHLGSVCGEGCAKGRHHGGCPNEVFELRARAAKATRLLRDVANSHGLNCLDSHPEPCDCVGDEVRAFLQELADTTWHGTTKEPEGGTILEKVRELAAALTETGEEKKTAWKNGYADALRRESALQKRVVELESEVKKQRDVEEDLVAGALADLADTMAENTKQMTGRIDFLARENAELRKRVAELESQAGIAAEMYRRVVAEKDDWQRKASDFATRRTERAEALQKRIAELEAEVKKQRDIAAEYLLCLDGVKHDARCVPGKTGGPGCDCANPNAPDCLVHFFTPCQRCEIESLRAERDAALEAAAEFRVKLWMGHGHLGLYGDDGQMQCNEGDHCDFKADPAEKLLRHVLEAVGGERDSIRAKLERAKDYVQGTDCWCNEINDAPCGRCRLLDELEG